LQTMLLEAGSATCMTIKEAVLEITQTI